MKIKCMIFLKELGFQNQEKLRFIKKLKVNKFRIMMKTKWLGHLGYLESMKNKKLGMRLERLKRQVLWAKVYMDGEEISLDNWDSVRLVLV